MKPGRTPITAMLSNSCKGDNHRRGSPPPEDCHLLVKDKMVLTGKVYAANEEPELEEEEEEPKDPRDELKEKCLTKSCSNYQLRLEECNDRVNSRTNTAETCTEELFDLFHCVDHCVAPNLFKHLK